MLPAMALLGPKNPLRIPIGESDFASAREEGMSLVDKTGFIADVLDNTAKVLIVPRPRRFGKTLNLSSLRYFADMSIPEARRRALFEDTEVWRHDGGRLQARCGAHPVIYLSFRQAKERTWQDCWRKLRDILQDEVKRLRDAYGLEEAFSGDAYTLRRLDALCAERATRITMAGALERLVKALFEATKRKVVVLIDEYDAPLHAAFEGGYWDEAVSFFRGLLTGGLKDTEALGKGVLTGILRVAKEGIFSGLNNVEVHGVLSPAMADRFGFTEPEVAELAEAANASAHVAEIRTWYNGYRFGDEASVIIYNPWSVLSFLKMTRLRPQSFWLNTSDNALIIDLLKRTTGSLGPSFAALLAGETVPVLIQDDVPLSQLRQTPNALWSLLTFSGYLTAESATSTLAGFECQLRIPNAEVREVFKGPFSAWLGVGDSGEQLRILTSAMLRGDAAGLEAALQQLLQNVMSFMDFGHDAPEATYHAFLLGLLVHLEGTHRVRSNREHALGRPDVAITPREPGPGVVLELKVPRKSPRQTPKSALEAAVKQLTERDYAAGLLADGATTVHQYAVVFDGKRCRVRLVPPGRPSPT
jgi:hypothetical protein